MINLGLKDKSKGFIKYNKDDGDKVKLAEGSLVHVIVQRKTSKLIRCTFDRSNQVKENDEDESEDDATKL